MVGWKIATALLLVCVVAGVLAEDEEININTIEFQKAHPLYSRLASKPHTEGRLMTSMLDRIRHLANSAVRKSPQKKLASEVYGDIIPADRFEQRLKPGSIPKVGHYGPATGLVFQRDTVTEVRAQEKPLFDEFVPLDDYDFRDYFLKMLYDVGQLGFDGQGLKGQPLAEKTLKLLFHLLEEVPILEKGSSSSEEPCPYSFDSVGHELCVSSVPISLSGADFETARTACREKGGDLAIIQDACQLEDIILYLRDIADPGLVYHYWLGASDEQSPTGATSGRRCFFWDDGTPLQKGVPYWSMANNPPPELYYGGSSFTPTAGGIDAVYLNTDTWRFNIGPSENETLEAKPLTSLCQYVRGRDGHLSNPRKPTGIVGIQNFGGDLAEAVREISINIENEKVSASGVENQLKPGAQKPIPFLSSPIGSKQKK